MQAHEMQANEMHAYEMQAHEMYAYEMQAMKCMPMRCMNQEIFDLSLSIPRRTPGPRGELLPGQVPVLVTCWSWPDRYRFINGS